MLALAATQAPLARAADAWPSKTLRIIVPVAPGGGADSSARVLAEVLAPQLGQSVIVENKPGAGSAIGVMAAKQSRDGHTLLMGSNSMVINPVLNPSISYDVPRDFDAIGMVSAQPLVWWHGGADFARIDLEIAEYDDAPLAPQALPARRA